MEREPPIHVPYIVCGKGLLKVVCRKRPSSREVLVMYDYTSKHSWKMCKKIKEKVEWAYGGKT